MMFFLYLLLLNFLFIKFLFFNLNFTIFPENDMYIFHLFVINSFFSSSSNLILIIV